MPLSTIYPVYTYASPSWVDSSTNTITTGTTSLWRTWTSDSTATVSNYTWGHWIRVDPAAVRWTQETPAPEEIARRAAEVQRQQEQMVAAAAERQRVEVTAQELLHSLLDEQQMKQWAERKRVVVKGKKRRYEVGEDNRLYVRDGSSVRAYCCHAPWAFPAGDRVAAAILELLTDEDAVVAKGNALSLSASEIMAIGERLRAA